MYIKWALLSICSFAVSLFCYITNPIVLLFCNGDGELPSFLRYWQTWDDSCNPSDVVCYKQLPSWLLYDFAGHYIVYEGTTPELEAVNRKRWFTRCYNNDWTLLERLRRYICRCYWLTRNCSYGFAFWWFGRTVNADKLITYTTPDGCYRKTTGEGVFSIADSRRIGSAFGYIINWNNYLGWKLGTNYQGPTRFMIAHRIALEFIKQEA